MPSRPRRVHLQSTLFTWMYIGTARFLLNNDSIGGVSKSLRQVLSIGQVVAAYARNVIAVMISTLYCFFALYASGMEAVMGATLVMMAGFLLYGLVAYRFVDRQAAAPSRA